MIDSATGWPHEGHNFMDHPGKRLPDGLQCLFLKKHKRSKDKKQGIPLDDIFLQLMSSTEAVQSKKSHTF
jgi:hypothetical protein